MKKTWFLAPAMTGALLLTTLTMAGGGNPAEQDSSGGAAPQPDSAAARIDPGTMEKGKQVYEQNCASCHQKNGEGVDGTFPPLARNPYLKDTAKLVQTIRTGHSGKITVEGKTFDSTMPPIGKNLSAEQIAQLMTYERNSWGNDYGPVSEAEVKKLMGDPSGTQAIKKPPVDKKLMSQGKQIYQRHCAMCHQDNGEGVAGAFPPLAGNSNLSNVKLVATTVHDGHTGEITVKGKTFDQTMPPVGQDFTDEQIAAIATYIRNAWGNDFGGASKSEVKSILAGDSSPPGE